MDPIIAEPSLKLGSRVRIFGLVARADLNGSFGTCLSFQSAQERSFTQHMILYALTPLEHLPVLQVHYLP